MGISVCSLEDQALVPFGISSNKLQLILEVIVLAVALLIKLSKILQESQHLLG